MAQARSLRDLDWVLTGLALGLALCGVWHIATATEGTQWASAWWRQGLWVGAGLMGMLLVARVDYHRWVDQAWAWYLLSLVGLALVLVVGREAYGARRWIPLGGGVHLQVAEFTKLAIIVVVARYLAELRTPCAQAIDVAKLGFIVGIPAALVIAEPDLGTAITYGSIPLAALFVARLPARYWVILGVAGLLVLPASWWMLRDYQKQRIYAFLNPSRDPLGSGYQVIQSRIAVGSGGLFGAETSQGSQARLQFLPVPHTDFIFAAYAEQRGFVGVVLALAAYLLLLLRIFENAQRAPDRAGMYLCVGVGVLLLCHIVINVGMVVGRMPVTGLPLPLMSYGGSSALCVFLMLGLVNSVRLQTFVNT